MNTAAPFETARLPAIDVPPRVAALAGDALATFTRQLPRAELHIHIEGSLEPDLAFKLAARNGLSLPWPDVAALKAAYNFSDLQSFLDLYYANAAVLRTEEDFFELAWAYLQRASADHVRRAEIFFDPQTHTERGVEMGTVIRGLRRACDRAAEQLNLSAELILCFLRHLSEQAAFETLEAAMPYRAHVIGVGLDSSEVGHPPEKFARVFARCRELGLHVVAHAGEEGPPAYIWAALDVLQAQRIDHGVRALTDVALMNRLAQQRVPLTVCPLSNLKLCGVSSLSQHAMKTLLDSGIVATCNSDDPSYFGGYVADNAVAVMHWPPRWCAGPTRSEWSLKEILP
jgi:adenine deaminase